MRRFGFESGFDPKVSMVLPVFGAGAADVRQGLQNGGSDPRYLPRRARQIPMHSYRRVRVATAVLSERKFTGYSSSPLRSDSCHL